MIELKYSTIENDIDEICLTQCPYKLNTKIGSYECKQCSYFYSDDFLSKTVKCKYENTK